MEVRSRKRFVQVVYPLLLNEVRAEKIARSAQRRENSKPIFKNAAVISCGRQHSRPAASITIISLTGNAAPKSPIPHPSGRPREQRWRSYTSHGPSEAEEGADGQHDDLMEHSENPSREGGSRRSSFPPSGLPVKPRIIAISRHT